MVQTRYDPEANAFHARFAPEIVMAVATQEVAPGVTIDLDAAGHLVAIDVQGVRLRIGGVYGTTKLAVTAR